MPGTSAARGRRVEWPTVSLVAATYLAWTAAGLWLWPAAPVPALAVMAVLGALHASLVHEAVHGHPTGRRGVDELLVCLPLTLLWPYRRFRALHLRHHRDRLITDPVEDPESGYMTADARAGLGPLALAARRANNTLAGRVVLGPPLSAWCLLRGDLRAIRAGDREVLVAWLAHLPAAAAVLALVSGLLGIPAWLYAATVAWGGLGLICVRSFAEHRWHPDPARRSIIVERSPLALLFLNNSLHAVHHAHPGVAWYALPALYRADRAGWAARNGGFVVPGYAAIAREHLLRARDPLVHPAGAAGEESRAPMSGVTHFTGRDGQVRGSMSGRRHRGAPSRAPAAPGRPCARPLVERDGAGPQPGHAGVEIERVEAAGRVPRGARGRLRALDQHDVGGEMAEHRAADHAAADHDDPRP